MSSEHGSCYYDILGIGRSASNKDIKAAYRSLCLKFHPDKLPEHQREQGTIKIKEINEAYSVLSNAEKKSVYDTQGKNGLSDRKPRSQYKRKVVVVDINISITVSLEDIYNGNAVNKRIERMDACHDCEATGYKDKQPHTCPFCEGSGVTIKMMRIGPIVQHMKCPCHQCNGSGESYAPPCNTCDGKKTVIGNHDVRIEIPHDVCAGSTVVIKGEGHVHIPYNSMRSNVIATIVEAPHAIFKRYSSNMSNLLTCINISLVESICGFKRSIMHMDHRVVVIVESCGVKNGDIKYLAGEGMKGKDAWTPNGDLFIKYEVDDSDITYEQKIAIYKILTGKEYNIEDLMADGAEMPISIDQSSHQSFDQSSHQSFDQSFDQSCHQSFHDIPRQHHQDQYYHPHHDEHINQCTHQ